MTSIPSNLARVPNTLSSRLSLANMNRTNVSLLRLQQQIATGRDILNTSDDIVKSATIATLDDRLERSLQLQRNLNHAGASLGVLDSALGEASTLALEAKAMASAQVNPTSSASERLGQASVVDSMIQALLNTANRQSVAGYIFGGSITTQQPVTELLGGFMYNGRGTGLVTDLGLASSVPITLGAGNPVISTSGRVRGTVDLDPNLTADTRVSDLRGARGLGVTLGEIRFTVNNGAIATVDLSNADTISEVASRMERAIRQYETDNSTTALGTGGVTMSGESLSLDIATGSTIEFFDVGAGVTGKDLGLVSTPTTVFSPTSTNGAALSVGLTWRSEVASLTGLSGPLGQFTLRNAGRSATIDLAGATTLGEIRNRIEGAGLGVRVSINADGTGLDVLTDLAAGSARSMSISDSSDGTGTATLLGIRTLTAETRVADFNFGRGVQIIDGQINPVTNVADPSLNTDIRITLGDTAATTIDIDLRPQDMGSVQDLLNRINSQIQDGLAAAGLGSSALVAELTPESNGLVLRQDPTFTGSLRANPINNSPAAEQLGLRNGTYDATSARLIGQDRATVRAEGLFTHMIDLRDALRANDVSGISLAGTGLEGVIGALAETRGVVGGFDQRVESAQVRETDRATLDEATRSVLRDTDYASAASKLALLQTQLQAGMQVAAQSLNRSLLDFLG